MPDVINKVQTNVRMPGIEKCCISALLLLICFLLLYVHCLDNEKCTFHLYGQVPNPI